MMDDRPGQRYADEYLNRHRMTTEAAARRPPETSYAAQFMGQPSDDVRTTEHVPPRSPLRALASPLALPGSLMRRLTHNERELANVEGNLFSTGQPIRCLWFTSASNGEGKSMAALNAAYGLAAMAARRVLLVDANPSAPSVARQFNTVDTPGLREVLSGETAVETALHSTPCQGLEVMTVGVGWDRFGGILPAEAMQDFLATVQVHYDFVILDGSSIYGNSDAQRIGSLCDGAILVAACERTKIEVLQNAATHLGHVGVMVLGVTLNRRRFYIPDALYGWLAR